jgi:hypothetical protein
MRGIFKVLLLVGLLVPLTSSADEWQIGHCLWMVADKDNKVLSLEEGHCGRRRVQSLTKKELLTKGRQATLRRGKVILLLLSTGEQREYYNPKDRTVRMKTTLAGR